MKQLSMTEKVADGPPATHLTLTFPFVTGNHYIKTDFRRRLHYVTAKGKAYRTAIFCDCVRQMGGAIGRYTPRYKNPVQVKLEIFPPDNRRRDSGNIIKVLYDALTLAGLWADDSLVRDEHITWGEACKPGRVELTVTEIER